MEHEAAVDNDVRLHVYEFFLEEGRPPSTAEAGLALGLTSEQAQASYGRLAEARVLVLAPGTANIWMANPLSAYPTPFWVETPRGSFFGNCIWDAFGVVAMLGGAGTVNTSCADCGDPMTLRVDSSALEKVEGVAHFAVPARRWWENIGYT